MSRFHKWLGHGVRCSALSLCISLAGLGAAYGDVTLIEQPQITDRFIRLGDVFTDVGDLDREIVLEAPAPGSTKKLSIYELERMAADFGLAFERPRYLSSIKIYRAGVPVEKEDLKFLIAQELQVFGITDDYLVSIFGRIDRTMMPADRSLTDIRFENISVAERKDRFSLEVVIPTDGLDDRRIRVNGRLQEQRLAPVLRRAIAPGEIIQASDIEWRDMPASRLTRRIVMSENKLLGQTVRRTLNPGALINANDVEAPIAIEKGATIILRYRKGPMKLSYLVRAVQDGGIGDYIRVQNPKSKTMVEAKIVSTEMVEVISPVLTSDSRH